MLPESLSIQDKYQVYIIINFKSSMIMKNQLNFLLWNSAAKILVMDNAIDINILDL